MKTSIQQFIQLAQRVTEQVNITSKYGESNPCMGIGYLRGDTVRFETYPFSCRVQIMPSENHHTSVDISFTSPLDSDSEKFDELFIEWTKNVDEFLASDSILLLDNQIKAGLRK